MQLCMYLIMTWNNLTTEVETENTQICVLKKFNFQSTLKISVDMNIIKYQSIRQPSQKG